jgi:hypothetical protein
MTIDTSQMNSKDITEINPEQLLIHISATYPTGFLGLHSPYVECDDTRRLFAVTWCVVCRTNKQENNKTN